MWTATLFEPSGLQCPQGLSFTWPLSQRHAPGTKLHIALLDKSGSKWLDTKQTANVDCSDTAAIGTVYHFSIYILMDQPPTEAAPPGYGGIQVEKAHGGFMTNTKGVEHSGHQGNKVGDDAFDAMQHLLEELKTYPFDEGSQILNVPRNNLLGPIKTSMFLREDQQQLLCGDCPQPRWRRLTQGTFTCVHISFIHPVTTVG